MQTHRRAADDGRRARDDHALQPGRFEDVRSEAESAHGGGVAMRYVRSPITTVTKVVFKGALGLPEKMLRGRMIERAGETPPLARAPDVAAALEELYHERGFLRAAVKIAPPIVEHDPDRATLVLAQVGSFAERMTAGRGFVAIAIVVLGRWSPFGVLAAALLFGALQALQFLLQGMGLDLPYQLFLVLPYALTLLALAGLVGRARAPAGLGK